MDENESLSHSRWECKYHIVFIPKCRRRTLYKELRQHLGEIFKKLASQKESRILEGHLMPDHVHMLIAIPPKYGMRPSVPSVQAGPDRSSLLFLTRMNHGIIEMLARSYRSLAKQWFKTVGLLPAAQP